MNRSAARNLLGPDRGAPRCPACGGPLAFRIDRSGRTTEQCDCGYRGYVVRRDALKPEPPPVPGV